MPFHFPSHLSLATWLALLLSVAAAAAGAAVPGPVVLDAPKLFGPFTVDRVPGDVYYNGQPAKEGIIDLTATNGFYNGFAGEEPQPGIAGDAGLIPSSFKYLRKEKAAAETPDDEAAAFRGARWHLYCPEPGEIRLTFFVKVSAEEARHVWPVALGAGAMPIAKMPRQTKPLHLVASDGASPQPERLAFAVKQPGRVSVILDAAKIPAEASASIAYIRAEGSAIAKARLLRARWRPAAIHVGFAAPAACPRPALWVFESKDVSGQGGYSPLTTPFGYYGLVFYNGQVRAGSGLNFSMWAAGRGATEAPPLEKMPRLIATGLAQASFGVFGGEGTGVKLRNASAYSQAAASTIQALRVTVDGGVPTYYGYFYDEPAHRWRLYCAGQKPPKRGRDVPPGGMLLARTGSFLEVPGPPGRQMSGDLVRTTARRGWFYGSDGKFYPALHGGDESTAREKPANQMVYYDAEGWVAMTMGGMEYYARTAKAAYKPAAAALPEYLRPDKVPGLFRLPVEFGPSKAAQVGERDAVLEYELKSTGPHSKAVLYYGPVDCITFPATDSPELKKGTPTMQAMAAKERTWQSQTPAQPLQAGVNRFPLGGLKAKTTYYYRLYVEHDEGKSWDYVSGSFKTN